MLHHLCLFEQAHNAEANTIVDQYMLNEVELQLYDLGLLFRFGKRRRKKKDFSHNKGLNKLHNLCPNLQSEGASARCGKSDFTQSELMDFTENQIVYDGHRLLLSDNFDILNRF